MLIFREIAHSEKLHYTTLFRRVVFAGNRINTFVQKTTKKFVKKSHTKIMLAHNDK